MNACFIFHDLLTLYQTPKIIRLPILIFPGLILGFTRLLPTQSYYQSSHAGRNECKLPFSYWRGITIAFKCPRWEASANLSFRVDWTIKIPLTVACWKLIECMHYQGLDSQMMMREKWPVGQSRDTMWEAGGKHIGNYNFPPTYLPSSGPCHSPIGVPISSLVGPYFLPPWFLFSLSLVTIAFEVLIYFLR